MQNTQQEVDIDFSAIYSQLESIVKKNREEVETLNILIAGQSGAGKSTLINAIFGNEVAKTGSGNPITQNLECYKNNEFCLYDTQGLELKSTEPLKKIEEFLQEQEQKSVKDQVHIAFLCIAEPSRRIQEKELFDLLAKYKFPTIVVITKASQDKDENGESFLEIVKNKLDVDDIKDIQRIRALALPDDEGNIKPLLGIDDLINRAYSLLPEGKKEAFARHQKYNKELQRKQRQKDASSIIAKYTAGASAVATTPIPFSDFALLLPTQCAMIVHISKIYDLELNQENIKKIVAGLAGVAGAGYTLKLAAGNILKSIPGLGSIAGGAINATIAGTSTKVMGELYSGYLAENYDNLDLSNFVDDILAFSKNK